VHRAKISTHLDQVVDVFYVTEETDRKVTDPRRIEMIRRQLIDVIDAN
jgi:[protein-PII] uridylyltransferase